jgi:hypothetical protein
MLNPFEKLKISGAHFNFQLFIHLIFFILCFGRFEFSYAQPALTDLDPTLINGKQYTFYTRGVRGHQFMSDGRFMEGTITIRDKVYENQILQYDLYNQILVLKFYNRQHADKIIVVSDAWLNAFSLGNARFEIHQTADSSKKIVQVIRHQSLEIQYLWKKEMKLENIERQYVFSAPMRETYLCINGTALRYRNNQSFAKAFGKNNALSVYKLLKQNKLNVKWASDDEMKTLLAQILPTLSFK